MRLLLEQGVPVVDLHGYAKAQTGYGAQTLQNIFSSGKNLEAIACSPRAHSDRPLGPRWRHPTHPIRPCLRRRSRAVLLVDRGLLQYEEKMAKYWPAFGQHGKEQITVEDVLRHEAGLQVSA